MSDVFNVREILEIAVRIEVNGARFYRKAAEMIDVPTSKELLLSLAEMEDEHEKIFRYFIQELEKEGGGGDFVDPDGDAAKYLGAVAGGYVFPVGEDPSDKLTGTETLPEIIDVALGLEKDSVVYYLGVKEIVPPALGRERIDRIITEEMRHITILSDLKRWL